ncbi:MAG: metallophosphoesterase family protein [Deltaproteobacteria bacterium]|nr:metallophosphoesterase family protein [Deltaproteobacteria bacterium]
MLCLSDIHGHADALAAVLAAAGERTYDAVLVAGDLCFPGPTPRQTWERLRAARAVCVRGLSDLALGTVGDEQLRGPADDGERARLARLRQARQELGPEILRELAALSPGHRRRLPGGQELLLVHGSPADPLEPMTHEMDDTELLELVGSDPAALVLCGGSHVPFDRTLRRPGARAGAGAPGASVVVRVVNLGSVGEAPGTLPDGGRFAHATLLEATAAGGLGVDQFVVPLGAAA